MLYVNDIDSRLKVGEYLLVRTDNPGRYILVTIALQPLSGRPIVLWDDATWQHVNTLDPECKLLGPYDTNSLDSIRPEEERK